METKFNLHYVCNSFTGKFGTLDILGKITTTLKAATQLRHFF